MTAAVSIGISPANLPVLAAQFALLADPLRLRIVEALAVEQLCTCHLIEITGAKQTTVSHHLRILREAGVVAGEPQGRFTWYHLTSGAFAEALRRLTGIADRDRSAPRLRPPCTP
jgi:ArsR family transcriptional regulator, arsenate/arsenite/antimonite-responsive transcriptional repressor